jgi:alpha-glucosidase
MSKVSILLGILVIAMCALTPRGGAQQRGKKDAAGHEWFNHAVFYEIYPRSFADSNGDGVGDLKGITSKLDYLQHLGIQAIWITPCFPSPQVDFGYDVSDYEAIDPMYGTLADFDELVAKAKTHNIKIILDFVPNHTSDQHKWFLESKSSKTNPKRDWYIWRDGKDGGKPPNNWTSTFGGSTWTLDPTTGQYYYHYFYAQQPDLNWRNPEVRKAMLDCMRFWYKRGVAGFRLDAVDTLFEDPDLKDNPLLPGLDKFGFPNEHEIYNKKLPEVHDVMRDMRKLADEYNAVLIGETWTANVAELRDYYGEKNDELQMPMDLMLTQFPRLSAPLFREHITALEDAGGWPVFVISNHDIVRSYTRWGKNTSDIDSSTERDQIAKLAATMYMLLRGTPIMYYGEEIGMMNNDPKRKEDVQDPQGRRGWPKEIGRDGERTPMQWSDGLNAGFTTGKPWLPIAPNYKTHNVATESKDPDSILSLYRKIIALRGSERALREGKYIELNGSDPYVLAFARQDVGGNSVVVALNMSDSAQKVKLELGKVAAPSARATTLIAIGAKVGTFSTEMDRFKSDDTIVSLEPYGIYVAKVDSRLR